MKSRTTLDIVRQLALFSSLTDGDARDVASCARVSRFSRGSIVLRQGKTSNALFVVLSGRARVLTADARGREVTLAFLKLGDFAGEMSLIDGRPHSATIQAVVDTDFLVIDGSAVVRHLPERTTVSYAVMIGLVQRLRGANRHIESLALLDVYGRVARTLLDMSEEVDSLRVIRKKVSRQDLAKVVGASREVVSRALKELVSRGLVEKQASGWLVLHDHTVA